MKSSISGPNSVQTPRIHQCRHQFPPSLSIISILNPILTDSLLITTIALRRKLVSNKKQSTDLPPSAMSYSRRSKSDNPKSMNSVKPLNLCGTSSERIKRSATPSLEGTVESAKKSLQPYDPLTTILTAQYEKELAHLIELKRENMHIFVDSARKTLQNLWDELFYTEEQMTEFTPAFTGNIPRKLCLLILSRYFHRRFSRGA
jgi:hypothetical protein